MKKSFLTLAAIALVLSFTSCKEDSAEKTEEVEVIQTETPAEVMETPTEEVVDTMSSDETTQVEENTTETSVN